MSLDERRVVARVQRLTLRELRAWVRQGWIRPASGPRGPVFDDLDVARIRLLCDLRKEMALPTDVIPVVLTLLDRMHGQRRDFRLLLEALRHEPAPVREAVLNRYVALRGSED